MGPENDIFIKITGEADLDAAQKQLQKLTKQSEDYGKQIEQNKEKEKQVSASLRQSIKNRKELSDVLIETHRHYSNQRKALKDNITANKQSIKALTDQIKAYKTLQGQTGRAVQQLRAMREELMRMEDAGEFGSEAFVELSIAAAELEDQIGDTQQRIRILASDTKELDAVMGMGDGLAGSFYIATSAAEIFGDDMEGLQKAFYKVQAAMSIVSGITQVYNAVQKDSAANVVIYNALSKTQAAVKAKEAVATGKATIAQKLYNKVLMSSPAAVILAVIAGLVAAYATLSEVLGRAGDKQARLNKMQEESDIKALQDETRLRVKLMQARGETALSVSKVEEKAAKDEMDIRQKAYDKAYKLWEKSNAFNRKKRENELNEAKEQLREARESYLSANEERLAQELTQEIDYRKQANQARVDVLKEDATKEIEQIKLNYQDQLKLIKGNTEEEIALRKALLAKQAKEISEVRKKYSLQALQVEVQEKKNLLTSMAQSRGTEADYEKELELTKEVAKKEAKARIDSLDKVNMSTKEYAAQKAAIELELAETIKRIDNDEATRKAENARRITEIELQEAEMRKNALTGAEGVDEQKAILEDYYATRKKQLEENARLEKEAVERSTDTEEVKTAKIKAIDAKLTADRKELEKEGNEEILALNEQYLTDLEIAASKAEDKVSKSYGAGKLAALKEQYNAQLDLYDEQQKQLKAKYDAHLISYQEFKQQEWEITKAITDAEVQYQQEKMQTIADGFSTALGYIQQISDTAFEALSSNVQAELDAFEKMYTTDWEEAQKNADKKYLTEKAYEKKKAALQEKQARYAKAQALINAGINTALAITNALSTWPVSLGIAMASIVGAMGAIQIGIIANKPLAQYAKGRKGGKGEYALVGEKGPEIMYVPSGASIVPNSLVATPEAWPKFGVPELPHTDREIMRYAAEQTAFGASIDYDRMGASVAEHLPKQRNVTVNVDRSGVHVLDGGNNRTYLNAKYNGSWS